ncbi:MAG TPA: hypothetical protein VN238_11395 [Solirubrobacteraceae bacterium]|nr:hypothetical protein [Solirubrobacteraceae bacterium]
MSPLERPVPPAGEEIHLPPGSAQPLLLTIGVTLSLLGITISPIILVTGIVLTVWVLFVWIRDAVHEYRHLPLEHHAHEPVDLVPWEEPEDTGH